MEEKVTRQYPLVSPYVKAYGEVFLGTYVPSFDIFYAHPAFRKNGRLQVWAVRILVEVLSWYRPDYDEDGQPVQRFPGERFALNYQRLSEKYRVSKRTLERAVKFLQEKGFLEVEVQYLQDAFGRMIGKRTLVAPNYTALHEVMEDLLGETRETEPGAQYPNGHRSDTSDASETRSDKHDASGNFLASPKRHICPTEATSLSHRSDISDAPKRQVCRLLNKNPVNKIPVNKNLSHPPAQQKIKAAANGRNKKFEESFPKRHTPSAHKAHPTENVLRDLGVPGKLRSSLAGMLESGQVTVEDVVAELCRCYSDSEVRKPVIVMATSLLRGNRPPREFYEPEALQHLPESIVEVLEKARWLSDGEESPKHDDPLEDLTWTSKTSSEMERVPDHLRPLWKKVLDSFRREMSPQSFQYLERAYPVGLENGVLTIQAADEADREWLASRVTNGMRNKLLGILGERVEVRFISAQAESCPG